MRIIYLLLIFACNPLPAASLLLGPMLGHVDDHSAKIWCALDEKGEVKVVSCGSNFELQGSNDGFKGFKVEQKKILDLFQQTEGVILLSGDRHFTAGYHIGEKTIEITSGPLGSGTVTPKKRNS